ncbi:MAG: chemotaxis protein CheR [Beggiatoa sp. IS2]|nr:MAG: chemotaxis protein CheR [Beggiatoa sp. IS2]
MHMYEKEFPFSRKDFELLRKLVNEHTGINLSEHKQEMLYSRLARRLRVLNLKDFATYCQILQSDCGDELIQFVNAVTTNLTSFFREPHHFDYLADVVLPQLLIKKQDSKRIRIWSAGCASGEEAYSIAMIIREVVPPYWDVKILATDLDSNVLEKAVQGVYEEERVESLSDDRLRRWFKKGSGVQTGKVHISSDLQSLITFKQLNLIRPWPLHGPLDIIFCRNVVIYFDKLTQKSLFERFANLLDYSGYLFIGHSENLFQLTNRFRLLKQTIYLKES